MIAVVGGLHSLLITVGLAVLVVGAAAIALGRVGWAHIAGRGRGLLVTLLGFALFVVGGTLSPAPKTDVTAAGDSRAAQSTTAATSSGVAPLAAVPTTSVPTSTAPTTTESTAAEVRPAPSLTISCPSGGSDASVAFGKKITAVKPYTVSITYGDGDDYSDDNKHLGAIFTHTYSVAGSFDVVAELTDAAGQTASATCTYTWHKPKAKASSSSSTSKKSSGSSGSSSTKKSSSSVYYQNCTEVKAAGAAPIYPGDPGWEQKFDRDGDGVGCES